MANTYRDDPLRSAHRADQIGVHQRGTGAHTPSWLLPLLAILFVLGLIWAFTRRQRAEPLSPAVTPTVEQLKNAVPDIPKPDVPKIEIPNPELADVPKPELSNAPKIEPPNVPEPRAAAALPPAPADVATDAESDTGATASDSACLETTFHFPTDQRELEREDRNKLRALADCLKEHPSAVMRVEGRAHPVDGRADARTEALALHRARTIEDELARQGVSSVQLRVMRSEPFCIDDDMACLARNRTVVVKSISGPAPSE